MTKVLLLPFFTEGYEKNIFERQLQAISDTLFSYGLNVTLSSPISTFEEAVNAQRTWNPYLFDLCVLVPITWSEPRLACVAARLFFGKPLVILAVNEFLLDGGRTEFSSAPAAAALYGCLTEMGVPARFLPGPLSEHEGKLRAIARASEAISKIRTARMGSVGHNFNGITAAGLDLSLLRRKFGTEVYSIDGSTVIGKAERLSDTSDRYESMRGKILQAYNGLPEHYLDKTVRITAALQELIEEYGLDALQVRCHTEFSGEYGLSMCLPLGIVGNTVAAACEADLPVLFTELVFKYLSGGKTPTYADLRTFTGTGMDVGACGFSPTDLTGGVGKVGGTDGYLTNSSDLSEGTLTVGRLLKRPGGALSFHAVRGKAERIRERLTEYGCAPYPMAHIVPECDMERFTQNTGANHYAIVYEDVTNALTEFAAWTETELL